MSIIGKLTRDFIFIILSYINHLLLSVFNLFIYMLHLIKRCINIHIRLYFDLRDGPLKMWFNM